MNQVCTRRPAASHFQPLGMWKGWDSASVCVRARSCFMVELTCLTHLSLNRATCTWYISPASRVNRVLLIKYRVQSVRGTVPRGLGTIVDHSPDKLYQVLPKSALPEG